MSLRAFFAAAVAAAEGVALVGDGDGLSPVELLDHCLAAAMVAPRRSGRRRWSWYRLRRG